MGYTIYESATRRIREALEVLESLRRREIITTDSINAIRLSRRARATALQTTFSELQQAFITPIDRDDLLCLCQSADGLHRAAENITLSLYTHGQSALTPNDTAAINFAVRECTLLYEAVEALARYPRDDTTVQKLNAMEHWHYERIHIDPPSIALFCNTCLVTAEHLRCILLKMI